MHIVVSSRTNLQRSSEYQCQSLILSQWLASTSHFDSVPGVPKTEITEYPRVLRAPKAEMTEYSRLPRVPGAETTEYSRVPRAPSAEMTGTRWYWYCDELCKSFVRSWLLRVTRPPNHHMPSLINTPRFTDELPRAAGLDAWRRNPSRTTIPIASS